MNEINLHTRHKHTQRQRIGRLSTQHVNQPKESNSSFKFSDPKNMLIGFSRGDFKEQFENMFLS